MQWHTSISSAKNGTRFVRGHELVKLALTHSFSDIAFLILSGRLPEERESRLFNAMLSITTEHGVEAPTAFIPRVIASCGSTLPAALAAGVLAIGERHGGAVEAAALLLRSSDTPLTIVEKYMHEKRKIPGFGHKVYTDHDPRTTALFSLIRDLGFTGTYIEKAEQMRRNIQEHYAKTLPINIDGALAVCLLELGLSPVLGKGLFAFARMPAMIAHSLEELETTSTYRRLDTEDVVYDGAPMV